VEDHLSVVYYYFHQQNSPIVLLIEELRDRREGKDRLNFFGSLMQLEGEGGVIVRQSFKEETQDL